MTENNNCVYDQNNYFSIHTIEFRATLDWPMYQNIQAKLLSGKYRTKPFGNQLKEESSRRYGGYYCYGFTKDGVIVTIKNNNYISSGKYNGFSEYTYFALELRVNPRTLIGDYSPIGIFEINPQNISKMFSRLNEILKEIGIRKAINCRYKKLHFGKKHPINHFVISRVDLCVNQEFDNSTSIIRYLQLLKQGKEMSFLKQYKPYDKTSHRRQHRKNEVYYSASSFDFVIYDKYSQMLDNPDAYTNISGEHNMLLRFEMRINKNKLRYIFRKYDGVYDIVERILELEKVSQKEISRYLKNLFFVGKFMTKSKAVDIIRSENPKNANKLIEFLDSVHNLKGVQAAIDMYADSGIKVDSILKKLNKLDINPITMPEYWGKECTYLSPYTLLECDRFKT